MCKDEKHTMDSNDMIYNKDNVFRIRSSCKKKKPRPRAFYMADKMHLFYTYICHTMIPHIKKFTDLMVHGVNSR